MTRILPIALLLACNVTKPLDPNAPHCPGGTQCDGPCPAGQVEGPHGLCTRPCAVDDDCQPGADGEGCLASLCAVSCDPSGTLDPCRYVVGPHASCRVVMGAPVCSDADSDTGEAP